MSHDPIGQALAADLERHLTREQAQGHVSPTDRGLIRRVIGHLNRPSAPPSWREPLKALLDRRTGTPQDRLASIQAWFDQEA